MDSRMRGPVTLEQQNRGLGALIFGALLALAAVVAFVTEGPVPGVILGAVAIFLLWSFGRHWNLW